MSDHALRMRAVYALRTRYNAPFDQIARVLGITEHRTHELYQSYLADAVWARHPHPVDAPHEGAVHE